MARDGVTMKLIGAKDLERALLALPERLQKSTIDRALLRVGAPIAADAKGRVNRAGGKPDVADKIIVSKNLSRRQRRGQTKEDGTRTIYIGVRPAPHAHLIEFGTGPRYTKAGAYRGSMPAAPFMRPAWDGGWRPALDDLGKILGEEIEKSARRLAKRQAKLLR